MEIKFEDIVFWIIILLMISLAIWLLFGSPTDTASIIAITIFVAGSEILIWKNLFKINNKSSIGFERVKSRFDKIDTKLEYINLQLNKIEKLVKG